MAETKNPVNREAKELVISRVINAPRELVFKAFTEPGRLAQWWGPKGFSLSVSKIDLRPGGIFLYSMKSPEGFEMWGRFVYREIVKPEKLVFIVSFSDKDGGITRHPMSDTWPLEVINTLTLTEQNGQTTLTLRGGPIHANEAERKTFEDGFSSMQQGFRGTFDQLDAYLETLNPEP